MIVRTTTVLCDQDECPNAMVLDPQATQTARTVHEAGWQLVNTDTDILTYCPSHHQENP